MKNNVENAVSAYSCNLSAPPVVVLSSAGDGLSELIDAHKNTLARVDKSSKSSHSAVEQDKTLQAAYEEEQTTLEELLQYSPRDLAEVRTKTAYFLEHLDFLGCEDPRMVMFLRAMI